MRILSLSHRLMHPSIDNHNIFNSPSVFDYEAIVVDIGGIAQTIQNAIDLDPDTAQFSIATPYPGTQLYKEIKEGKWGKFLTEDLKNYSGSAAVTWLPEGYSSPEELKKMQSYAFRRFYLRPKYILKQIH